MESTPTSSRVPRARTFEEALNIFNASPERGEVLFAVRDINICARLLETIRRQPEQDAHVLTKLGRSRDGDKPPVTGYLVTWTRTTRHDGEQG